MTSPQPLNPPPPQIPQPTYEWHLPDRVWDLRRPRLMAIVNVTPDSFYDGGRYQGLDAALARAEQALEQGADLLDIGGESTRPGAPAVDSDEECRRVLPVLELLARRFSVPLSIDTLKPSVAEKAIQSGACIVNDVTGLEHPDMGALVARTGVSVVLMHMRGTPATMQQHTHYQDLMAEVTGELELRLNAALRLGIPRGRIALDPGIGFAKTAADNLVLLRRLGMLHCLGCPLLVGASRKSFLGKLFGFAPEDRLEGSLAAAAAAVMAGAGIVRVHDVEATRRLIDVTAGIRDASERVTG